MKKIYKYPIEVVGRQTVSLPKGAIILTAMSQHGSYFIWAYVDPEEKGVEDVKIRIYGTGQDMDESLEITYVGSMVTSDGCFVWHVFKED